MQLYPAPRRLHSGRAHSTGMRRSTNGQQAARANGEQNQGSEGVYFELGCENDEKATENLRALCWFKESYTQATSRLRKGSEWVLKLGSEWAE